MNLTADAEPLAYDVAYDVIDEAPDLALLEMRARDTTRKLRALAAIVLLTRADVARFHSNLRYAAGLRYDYLLAAAALPDPQSAGREYAAGRFMGLFDALAGGDAALAARIARLEPAKWRPDCEYEDDFCYARFVHRLLLGEASLGPEITALLDRFDSSLEGTGSARLTVCRALLANDAAAFDAAFEALLQEHTLAIAERIELGEMDDTVVVAERRIFVEGLGLLLLAERQGLETREEFLYCPSIGRAWRSRE